MIAYKFLRAGATSAFSDRQWPPPGTWLEAGAARIPLAPLRVQLPALEAAGLTAFHVVTDTELADRYWARAQAVAEQLGAARSILRAATLELPVGMVQSVGDAVLLSVPTAELRQLLSDAAARDEEKS